MTLNVYDNIIIRLTITDAYYVDIDGDEILDVVGYFQVSVEGDDIENIDLLMIFPKLKLPSGLTFRYRFDITDNHQWESSLDYQIIFYDHAFESGDYTFIIDIIVLYEGHILLNRAEYVFDPPGGNPGGDPYAMLHIISW